MAVTVAGEGNSTQTVGGAEVTLYAGSGEGVFVFWVDTNLMAAGDVIILRRKRSARPSGTARTIDSVMIAGVQPADGLIYQCAPVTAGPLVNVEFSIEQDYGTARALPWSVEKL